MSIMESNIPANAALEINIPNRKEKAGVTYYCVILKNNFTEGEQPIQTRLEKRYNMFKELYQQLEKLNFKNIPSLPAANLFMSDKDLLNRQVGLQNWLRYLVNRMDTRNSQPVVQFLNLQKFCPEILNSQPELILNDECPKNFYVTHCIFLSKYNIFILALLNKVQKISCLEVHSFKQTGAISDTYLLRSNSMNNKKGDRLSMLEVLESPRRANQASIFEKQTSEPNLKNKSFTNGVKAQKITMRLMVIPANGKITSLCYCEDLDIISVGIARKDGANIRGDIINFNITVEKAWEDNKKPFKRENMMDPNVLAIQGNVLQTITFTQKQDDLPTVDANNGSFKQIGFSGSFEEIYDIEEEKQETDDDFFNQSPRSPTLVNPQLNTLKLISHSMSYPHSKTITGMLIDNSLSKETRRNHLITCSDDRRILTHCLASNKKIRDFKLINGRPVCMQVDLSIQVLYVATKEGMLLIFDIKGNSMDSMYMLTSMKLVQNPSPNGKNYIKSMELDLDLEGTILACMMKSSVVYQVTLVKKQLASSFVSQPIVNYAVRKNNTDDSAARFAYMSRMAQCYVEGTRKGFVRIRQLFTSKGNNNLLMQLPTNFTDKVVTLHYDKTRNLLIGASKDGKFNIWKIPHEWRPKRIVEKEERLNGNEAFKAPQQYQNKGNII